MNNDPPIPDGPIGAAVIMMIAHGHARAIVKVCNSKVANEISQKVLDLYEQASLKQADMLISIICTLYAVFSVAGITDPRLQTAIYHEIVSKVPPRKEHSKEAEAFVKKTIDEILKGGTKP